MEYNFLEIAKRIRDYRKKKKMSQDRFIEELSYRGVTIARNRLSKIESGESKAFDLDFILACCKIFDTDLGHLMGEYNEKTLDINFVCTITGLSEDAVSIITNLQCGDILSALIVQPEFAEVVEKIRRLQDNSQMDYLERHDIASAIFANIKSGKGHIPFDDRRDSLRYRIGTLFATMVDRLTGK